MRPLAALLLPLFLCAPAPGQNYTVYTFAGGGLPNNVPARSASLSSVVAVAVDAGGNMYIAASALNVIFRVDAGTGQLTRFAGNGTAGYSGDNGPAAGAKLSGPLAVAVDAAGNVYIADTYNNVIRKVSSGVITTIAGNGSGAGNATVGSGGYSGDGGPATSAQLNNPYGVAVDAGGSLYIADGFNNVIRKVSNGVISTFAGNGYGAGVGPVTGGYSGDNGQAVSAELDRPSGVAVDAAGSVYIADSGNNVVRLVSNGLITTVAGNGTLGSSGDNGPAISAQLFQPNSVAVDTAGNLYVSFFMGNTVRRITNGVITTVAGGGYQTGPEYNGPATNLESFDIECAAVDTAGNLYIADAGNNVIRKVAKGVISTVAGNGAPSYSGDNDPATSAELYIPQGVAVDTASDVYIADHGNNVVRMVSKGIITTIAGNGTGGYSGDVGLAASAQLNGPTGVAVDANGNLYIADAGNNVIREVSNGIITTLAGNGKAGYSGDNGPAASAQLSLPSGVAVDTAGNLHIADTGNQRVRKISNGLITTIAGNGASYQIGPSTTGGYSGDGGPATDAELNMPRGVAVDLSGNVYIDDASNGEFARSRTE
jgi:sugar lactone lactonase YvrE